ncbi:MAG: hypothetical protein WBB68_00430 [Candidatus Moraniibacteriota bacterium]
MSDNAALNQFIQARPHLVWHMRDLEQLSASSIVEHTLNYGTWQDVQDLFALIGLDATAKVFFDQQEKPRSNYRPEIANYFRLYFSRYAAR